MPRIEDENPLRPGHKRRLSREGVWLAILVIATTLAGPMAVAAWYWSTHTEAEIRTQLGGKD